MYLSGADTQDFPLHRGQTQDRPTSDTRRGSSYFASPKQFAVLSYSESDTEDIGVLPQPNSRKYLIPSTVV
jgi:hypothetical protein